MTYDNVWIVTNYIGGGIRGVYLSQHAAEASIREIRREYPDMKRPDFTVQVERIRGTVESATSDPARVQSDAPAQGERLRDANSSSLVLSSSSLRTLVEQLLADLREALADRQPSTRGICGSCGVNHENEARLNRAVLSGITQRLKRIAALLSPVAVEETHEDALTRSGKPDVVTDSATRSDQPKG